MLAHAAKRSAQTSLLLTTLAVLIGLSVLFLLTASTRAASVTGSAAVGISLPESRTRLLNKVGGTTSARTPARGAD